MQSKHSGIIITNDWENYFDIGTKKRNLG